MVLTIAGFDPSSGAGVTADLAVMAAHGLFGVSAVTALTVQSTLGVRSSHPVEPEVLAETLRALDEDLPATGVKIGMLATAATVSVVVDFLARRQGHGPVVLDPVIRSSSGRELLEPEGLRKLQEELLPLVDWITPNLTELALLTGHPVHDAAEVEVAVAALRRSQPRLGVVATGGHLAAPNDLVAAPEIEPVWLAGERVESRATHGTGCAYSTALLCGLVQGLSPVEAARAAKAYVTEAIRRAEPRGQGHGPMELYWPMR